MTAVPPEVQNWMALDLWMALGRDSEAIPDPAFGEWAEMLAAVRAALAEVERLREMRRRVTTVHVWTNEDGKRFVFADDLLAAVDGVAKDRDENGPSGRLSATESVPGAVPRIPGTPDGDGALSPAMVRAMRRQLALDRKVSRYWRDKWGEHPDDPYAIDAWLTSLGDWLGMDDAYEDYSGEASDV